ncbi:MAG: uroporphyrinogen decarboxylase [Melioribacteraceae bacterium]|nr:uroporphyrinogen decarboxylase [Melioribacteraceae bacterium]MCF8264510.1 uroporphyrinogen decarboxylase [Melioribacteraceae bacterium]MCF8412476.1 uroporphyrinogen decarboxylase [Melioribacteraceae bacterium]
MTQLQNDLFLRACRREVIERTPIWIMRQAGRYLPEYRAVRKNSDFLTMCKTPELASEVTIQPIDLIGVDAAILFSDILVIPEAMGMELLMVESKGPQFPKPIRNADDAKALKQIDPTKDLKYVLDAIKMTKENLNNRVPLIGFSGSPWTLLTYMVEGGGSKTFSKVKNLIFNDPELAHNLLDKISDAVADYLNAKIEAGVNAVQIFDTWGGILAPHHFYEFSLNYVEKIISKLKVTDQPVIFFPKGISSGWNKIAKTGATVIGLDWTVNIGKVRERIGDKVALQGNMDPTILYGNVDKIEIEATKVMDSYGNGSGHIFNLGHGILPDVKPAHAKALVDFIKSKSSKYHIK